MTTIQNPFRGINTSLGTSKRESTGEALAGLVSASLQTYAKVKEIDKKFDEEQDNKLGETEMIAYNDKMSQYRAQDLENDVSAMTSNDYYQYKKKQQEDLSSVVGGFNSSWAKKRSSDLVSVFDKEIEVAGLTYQKELKAEFISQQIPSLVNNPMASEEEKNNIFKAISSFQTGEEYKMESFVTDMAKSTVARLAEIEARVESGNYRESDLALAKQITQSNLDYIKNPELTSKINGAYNALNDKHINIQSERLSNSVTALLYNEKTTAADIKNKIKQIKSLPSEYANTKYTLLNRLDSTLTSMTKSTEEVDYMAIFDAKKTIETLTNEVNNGRVLEPSDKKEIDKQFNYLMNNATTPNQRAELALKRDELLRNDNLVNVISDNLGTKNFSTTNTLLNDTKTSELTKKTINNILTNDMALFLQNPTEEKAIEIKAKADTVNITPKVLEEAKKKLTGEMQFQTIEELKAITMLADTYSKKGGALGDKAVVVSIGQILNDTNMLDKDGNYKSKEVLDKVNATLTEYSKNKDTLQTSKNFVKLQGDIETTDFFDLSLDKKVDSKTIKALYEYMVQKDGTRMYYTDDEVVAQAKDVLVSTYSAGSTVKRSWTPFMDRADMVLPMEAQAKNGKTVPITSENFSDFIDDYAKRKNVSRTDLKIHSTIGYDGKPKLVIMDGKFPDIIDGNTIYYKAIELGQNNGNN